MIQHGDCLELMRAMPEASVDAIVTDPPYGLEFMGMAWDTMREDGKPRARNEWGDFGSREHARHPSEVQAIRRNKGLAFQQFSLAWATEALRIAKPGAHLLAFGGTRTFHRLAGALEDAGWEIRDTLCWLYGSGFPKSLDVSKALDKAAGAERECTRPGVVQRDGYGEDWDTGDSAQRPRYDLPATDAARAWEGWGTALKPAWEPIILARKPLVGTVATNVTVHGTGALNIDGCRIGGNGGNRRDNLSTTEPRGAAMGAYAVPAAAVDGLGRWPANVVLDPEAAALLDAQSGERPGMREATLNRGATTGKGLGYGSTSPQSAGLVGYGDTGGASRFFYCAKASRAEREEGLAEIAARQRDDSRTADQPMNGGDGNPYNRGVAPRRNHHPTVKPVALMRWLVRLVAPPGGLVLDPFAGSGTTGIACALEGVRFLGLEREAEYVAIAEARLRSVERGPAAWLVFDGRDEGRDSEDPAQPSLFGNAG